MCKNCIENKGMLTEESTKFEIALMRHFNESTRSGVSVFLTDCKDEMYNLYLNNFETEEITKYFACNACKKFFDRYATLCTINEQGIVESLLWNIDIESIPEVFRNSVTAMNNAVKRSKINNIFKTKSNILGLPEAGGWTHFHVYAPENTKVNNYNETAGQTMARYREYHSTLRHAVYNYNSHVVRKAKNLLDCDLLYRGDVIRGVCNWFYELRKGVDNQKKDIKENLIWEATAIAPEGFCNFNSGMFGSLLKDIKEAQEEGTLNYDDIIARFKSKMDPSMYQRSQSAPTVNARDAAEKMIVELGLVDSLSRRFATIEEIPEFVWKAKIIEDKKTPVTGGIFGNIITKDKPKNIEHDLGDLPTTVMTWEKFQKTILPNADTISALTNNTSRFMALVTSQDSSSENIMQWNNPFSWYYHGGADGEMKRRLKEYGGDYENNKMRCSLMWNGLTDLDLHCINPLGEHIHFNNKEGSCGGYLDLDMNGLDQNSRTPVENIRWKNRIVNGKYLLSVHNYTEKVNYGTGTSFEIELEIAGKLYKRSFENLMHKYEVHMFCFMYQDGKVTFLNENMQEDKTIVPESINGSVWNVDGNRFVKVNGIVKSPNLWGDSKAAHAGNHTFFLLDNCQDVSEDNEGRGFFNEFLRSDLKGMRKVLEAYTASTPILGKEESSACGLGFNKDNEWNLTLRVNIDGEDRYIKIDRFE